MLVVSADAFNKASGTPIVLPITTGSRFARGAGFGVPIAGIATSGVVRCDQPRALDLKARKGRKVDVLPSAQLDEVMAKLATLFE